MDNTPDIDKISPVEELIPQEEVAAPQPQVEPTMNEAEQVEASPEAEDAAADDTADIIAAPTGAVENIPAADEQEIAELMQRKDRKMSRRKKRKTAKRMRILNLTLDKDIRYRGPLSYRMVRIVAWLCFLLSQMGMLMAFAAKMDAGYAAQVGAWPRILSVLNNYMTPLFLIATFAVILNNSRKFSSLLILYGGFSIVFYSLFCLLHDRYLVGVLMAFGEMTREEAVKALDYFIVLMCKSGYFSFNVFIDLFLCTLFTFFVVYRPKRVFVGKYLIIFRLFAIFPALYEVASIVVKALASIGTITLTSYVYPLLTTKPPFTFLVFVSLTFFIKRREWLYRRYGKTHEQYQAFLGTKLNSLQFSTFLAGQFTLWSVVDLIFLIVLSFSIQGRFAGMEDPFGAAMDVVLSWGFGDCATLLILSPFVLLFSYTRVHKDTRMDLIINLLGIIALVLIYLEALYQGVIYEIDVIKGLLPVLGGMMGA